MEDFGYKSEDEQNYTKMLIKKALLLSLLIFSIFCFLYIGVNAYNYFQSNKEIKTIEAKVKNIKTYPKVGGFGATDSAIKIDSSIYEDIFGTRKRGKEEVKVKKIVRPEIPPKKTEIVQNNKKIVKEITKPKVRKSTKLGRKTPNGRRMARVQLAAMTTKESAIMFLKVAKSKYSNIFSGLDGYIQEVDLGKRGVFFRVQVGDFYDQIRAETFCKKYIAAAQKSRSDCIVVD